MNTKEQVVTEKQVRNKTLIAFMFFFLFLGLCITGWIWLQHQPKEQGALKPLRAGLNTNESIFSYFFSGRHLSKVYPRSAAVSRPRVNGNIGLKDDFDPSKWKLQLIKVPGDTILISLDEIKALPKTEIIFDFKCIEGWSQVTHWAGVRFSDFVNKFGLDKQSEMGYTGLSTPDHEYYVGNDNASMMHPQTMLCYEMNGAPLPMNQGYPLRLIIPVKYGIKHLKRIGSIYFSNKRPPDYWYEKGYDYYSGL
jgi:DMSO/TMAO reductase YedYZ molybdopterin-dependent catalytic subunit